MDDYLFLAVFSGLFGGLCGFLLGFGESMQAVDAFLVAALFNPGF